MRKLTRKQKLMGTAATVLVLLVLARYAGPVLDRLPTPKALDRMEDELRQLRSRLQRLQEHNEREQAEILKLRRNTKPLLWEARGRVLGTVLQNELQNLARRNRITLRNVYAPRSREVSEYVRAVEISVRMQGDIREIGRLVAAVENAQPRLSWSNCTIRPINIRDPDKLDLNGRVEALFAVDEAERLLFGEEGS